MPYLLLPVKSLYMAPSRQKGVFAVWLVLVAPANGIIQKEKCKFLSHPQVEQGHALGGDGLSLELKLQSTQAAPTVVAAHETRTRWKHSWVYQTESCGHPWVDVCARFWEWNDL